MTHTLKFLIHWRLALLLSLLIGLASESAQVQAAPQNSDQLGTFSGAVDESPEIEINVNTNDPVATEAGSTIKIFFYQPVTVNDAVASDFTVSGAPGITVTSLEVASADFNYTLELTLSGAIAKNAVVNLAYTAGANGISTESGMLSDFSSARVITSNIQAVAPEITTAEVNAAGNAIILTFDKEVNLNNLSTIRFGVRVFPVAGLGGTQRGAVTGLSLSNNKKVLTLSLGITVSHGERVNLTYFKLPTDTGTITGDDGSVVAFFAYRSLVNTVPPLAITDISTVPIRGLDKTGICMTFNADVLYFREELERRKTDFTVLSSGGDSDLDPLAIEGFTRCFDASVDLPNTVRIQLNREVTFGEIITLAYTKTGTDTGLDRDRNRGIRKENGGEVLADFSARPVTNNAIEGLPIGPTQTFSEPNQILLAFGIEILTVSDDQNPADFTISGAASNPVVTGISIPVSSPSALLLTLSSNIVGGETITLSYTKTVGSITGHTKGELVNFADHPVTNYRPVPAGTSEVEETGASGASSQTLSTTVPTVNDAASTLEDPTDSTADTVTGTVVDSTAPTIAVPSINISPTTITATVGTAITGITITSTGGAVASYGIATTLPDGLTLDTSNDTISGTPTAVSGSTTYAITATNSAGTDTATVAITVNDVAPSINISPATITATVGTAIADTTITSTGGAVVSYSIDPAISNGLSFNKTTGVISGTATAAAPATNYIITATNTGGTDTATVAITVLADGLSEKDIQRLNQAIMPRLTQALVASSAASVERRVDSAFASAETAASYQLDGYQIQFNSETTTTEKLTADLLQKLAGYTRSHKDGNINWKQLLTNSSFLIPLNSADQTSANQTDADQASAANTGLALWGSGDYTRLSENDSGLDWQGDLTSLQLGLDKRLDNLLLGGMVTWSEGDVDYTLEGDEGSYNHKMTSIHPYLAWNKDHTNLWGSLGYGQGDLTLKHQKKAQEGNTYSSHSTDTNLLSLAAGIKGQLISGLSLKSDLLLARTDINAAADMNIAKQTIDSQRFRLLLEIAGQYTLASGGSIKPMLEIGARYDGDSGDSGNSGTGAVLGAGMRYANLTGLTLEGNLHALVGQGNYKEWGIQALISLDPGTDKLGLAFSLRPGYGYNGSSSDTSALWQQSLPQSNLHNSAVDYSAPDYDARLGARLSYGLLAPSLVGLLTPYSEITLGTINSYRLGIRWQGTARFDLHLFGERRESSVHLEGSRGADQAIQLEGRIHF